jgi:hypothetical protein
MIRGQSLGEGFLTWGTDYCIYVKTSSKKNYFDEEDF